LVRWATSSINFKMYLKKGAVDTQKNIIAIKTQ